MGLTSGIFDGLSGIADGIPSSTGQGASSGQDPNGFIGGFVDRFVNKKYAAPMPENNLRADIMRMRGERELMAPNVARSIGSAGNARSRLSAQLGRDASMRVAQADQVAPYSFRGALDQATKRMRARQSIVDRGDAAIRNQTLRDRIAIARTNATKRGVTQNALQQAVNIREGVNVGIADANQLVANSRAQMFGSLAGGVLRVAGAYANRGPSYAPTAEGTAVGTGYADYINSNPPQDFLDFDTVPTGNV